MNLNILKIFSTFVLLTSVCFTGKGQNAPDKVAGIPVNYDEALVGSYSLPDPLVLLNGRKVKNVNTWYRKRRPEILELFKENQFGKSPVRDHTSFSLTDHGTPAFGGKAIRKQITIYLTNNRSNHKADLLVYLPANMQKPVPLFFNISFFPNSMTVDDPGVKPGMMWNREGQRVPANMERKFGHLDVGKFLAEGFGVATIYYGDIEPDFAEGIKYGIRSHYLKPGTQYPAPDEWGAIASWAWGLSCAMDYFETDNQIDPQKIALFGVSRLGKTALWAGASDTRFGMVIASCSGEGGAALSRRNYGETIQHMTDSSRYFYQFCGNRAKYSDDPGKSPVDAHLLISLIAPRPLLLQTGDTDYWSDPKGEFLAAVAAEPVYRLLGKTGLNTCVMPHTGTPVLNDIGYYMHAGGHGALPEDYNIYLRFMKKHFSK